MRTTRYTTGFLVALLAVPSFGCGTFTKSKGSGQAAAGSTDAGTSQATGNTANLQVLSPGALATKIYSAFGSGMTKTTSSKGTSVDYLLVNQTNFTGSVSSDPNDRIASSFSIGYFMALAGLAEVVGTNYQVALKKGLAANDCRVGTGAQAILTNIAPTMSATDAANIAGALVNACLEDPASAVSAVVQSYSTALKSTL